MKFRVADIEANGLKPTKIHVAVVHEIPEGITRIFTDMKEFSEYVILQGEVRWVFHNGLAYDVPVINRLLGGIIDPKKVIDTMVVSKLVDYKKYNTHSLDEIGSSLGCPKTEYTGGWDVCTQEMIDYCEDDVDVLVRIFHHFKKYLTDPSWSKALRVEHNMATLCNTMHENGFSFNIDKAVHLLGEVKDEMSELEDSFKKAFGSKLTEVKRIKYRKKKDGTLFSNVITALSEYPKTEVEGDELVCYDYLEFNPGSPQQRIDVLWDAGWKPYEKTKGHIESTRRRW